METIRKYLKTALAVATAVGVVLNEVIRYIGQYIEASF